MVETNTIQFQNQQHGLYANQQQGIIHKDALSTGGITHPIVGQPTTFATPSTATPMPMAPLTTNTVPMVPVNTTTTTGIVPTATTATPRAKHAGSTGMLSKWQRRRQAKKLRKQRLKNNNATMATTATTTSGHHNHLGAGASNIELEKTMHETFYSMPVVVGQSSTMMHAPNTASTYGTTATRRTGGPKLTRSEKRAWKKRQKKEAALINTGRADEKGMVANKKLMHDLKKDKLGPIHPAATIVQQQQPIVQTAAPVPTTTTFPATTTTTTTTRNVGTTGPLTSQMNNLNLGQ